MNRGSETQQIGTRFEVLVFLFCLLIPGLVQAATRTVNSLDDVNDGACDGSHCSLREAISAAGPGDLINFSFSPPVTPVITLSSELPPLLGANLRLDGLDCGGCGPVAGNTNLPAQGFNSVIGPTIDSSGVASATPVLQVRGSGITLLGLNIQGGGGVGVEITATGVTVRDCFIGTDRSGTTGVGNASAGIHIDSSDFATLGPGNLISGNGGDGILMTGFLADDASIVGNIIGLDVGASALLGNSGDGLHAEMTTNAIGIERMALGTMAAADRNIISGNAGHGVSYLARLVDCNIIGNTIGLSGDQSQALGNGGDGIWLGAISGGGNNRPQRDIISNNTISGNVGSGIHMEAAKDTVISSNGIGTDSGGLGTLGNGGEGIYLLGGSFSKTDRSVIGGAGIENTIRNNGGDGIRLRVGPGGQRVEKNDIARNLITNNGGLAIDLEANSVGDGPLLPLTSSCDNDDSYGERGAGAPVIGSALFSAGVLTVMGSACADSTVHLYQASGDASGHGELELHLGSTAASGAGAWTFVLASPPLVVGDLLTAVSQQNDNDTSEAAANVLVTGPPSCDNDGDGVNGPSCSGADCNDNDAAIHPGALEFCDNLDSDCDGSLVDGFADADGDGIPNCIDSDDDNDGDPDATDCAPLDASRGATVAEIPNNGIDEDCDGFDATVCFADADGDSYGSTLSVGSVDSDCLDPGESSVSTDCDDSDLTAYPAAPEACDNVDSDCDGDLLDGFPDTDGDGTPNCIDPDADGDGDPATSDCDDRNPAVFHGAVEVPGDGIDQDCSGADAITCFEDADGDGPGSALTLFSADSDCADPGESSLSTDCDDSDATMYPGALESCDNVDSDCDGSLVDGYADTDGDGIPDCVDADIDADGDGSQLGLDCDDGDATRYPGAVEICDAIDQDCDGDLVAGFTDTDGDGLPDCVEIDADGDGEPNVSDCGPFDASIAPGAPEVVGDGIDQDCNGSDAVLCFMDSDGDAHGGLLQFIAGDGDCNDPGEASVSTDCDDGDASIFPSAAESCDNVDSDCDNDLVDGFPDADADGLPDCIDNHVDADGDGAVSLVDCDDSDPSRYPGAIEFCDTIDSDCDGDRVDGFPDLDGDGDPDCTDPDVDGDGVPSPSDCNDLDPAVHPGAAEIPDNSIDEDCDSQLGITCFLDNDGDGYGSLLPLFSPDADCGGAAEAGQPDDCDDSDPAVHPGAVESCDAIDGDCDGGLLDGAADSDGDGEPDCIDPDDDNDGALDGDDCAPVDPSRRPGAVEFCDAIDSDCDGDLVDGFGDQDGDGAPDCIDGDDDGDGFDASSDCNDNDPAIYPGSPEICDTVDSDCDGSLVDGFADLDGDGDPDCIDEDDDDDGFLDGDDCDPLDPATHLGAPEFCDGLDNDCDGDLVDGFGDADGDGIPDCVDIDLDGDGSPVLFDCDDSDPGRFPGNVEICDAVDSDCDGSLVDAFPNRDDDGEPDCIDPDDDGDGHVDLLDCGPLDPTIFPGAQEFCDGIDSNCDGTITDGFVDTDGNGVPDCVDQDADADGYLADVDCDDTDPAIHPGVIELCDSVDGDCDGSLVDGYADSDLDREPDCVDPDDDNDGFLDADDCAPTDLSAFPGAPEQCDGLDADCDGSLVDGFLDTDGDGYPDCVDVDIDGDGFDAWQDCDDLDPAIHDGAVEILGDGVDQDCSGADSILCFQDTDFDGYGSTATQVESDGDCDQPGESWVDSDCDPLDGATYPGSTEIADDGVDQDCNGFDTVSCYADGDGDGFGSADPVVPVQSEDGDCADLGESSSFTDCADGDDTIHPGALEQCDLIDSDCDGSLADEFPDADLDSLPDCIDPDDDDDGFLDAGDCGPLDPAVFPGAVEFCDDLDGDCDGSYADDFDDLDGDDLPDCVDPDVDGDGWQAAGEPPDCDDLEATIHPGARELCNGVDDDCDPETDENVDWDGDGLTVCDGDCDDGSAAISPENIQRCEAADTDCDPETLADFDDLDGDGSPACDGDCDDEDAFTYPGAPELCDDKDNDCDGSVEGPTDVDFLEWFEDADDDGFGDEQAPWSQNPSCSQPDGYVLVAGDCDDGDPDAWPGALEICADGVDQDCDLTEAVTGDDPECWERAGCDCDASLGGRDAQPGGWLLGLLFLLRARRRREDRP